MQLPAGAHTSRPWRIHELTRDFRLEDVWALPTPGGAGDFPRLVRRFSRGDPSQGAGGLTALLFAVRRKVGALLGWDDESSGFTELYLLEDEWAAEIANRTMQGVLHLGWVEDGAGGYRGQMAVLVKPNGLLGHAYMAAIRPFRHRIVYPAMLRRLERDWTAPQPPPSSST